LNIVDLSHNRLSGSLPPCIGAIPFGYHTDDDDFLSTYFYDMAFYFAVGLSKVDYGDLWPLYDSPLYGANYFFQGFTFSTKGNIYSYSRGFYKLMSGIDLSANMLSGEIPWEIGNLSHVKSLNLSHNFFIGQIPATFANMSALESLDLSHNELNGPIPWQLTQMSSLEVFSVAYNNLSGCIPNSGQFSSFNMGSYLGNTNLQNSSQGNQCSVLGPMEVEDVGEASDDLVLYIICAGLIRIGILGNCCVLVLPSIWTACGASAIVHHNYCWAGATNVFIFILVMCNDKAMFFYVLNLWNKLSGV